MQIETKPKFQRLAELLESRIHRGEWEPGAKLPGERVLAQQYGLSHPTVNKAIAGLVSSGLLRREPGNGTFVAMAEKAAALTTVAVLMDASPDNHSPFLTALPSFLVQHGFTPLVLNADWQETTRRHLRQVIASRPKALIVHGRTTAPFPDLADAGGQTHLVFVGEYDWPERFPGTYVLTDFEAAGYLAATHLLRRGRRRIAWLATRTLEQTSPQGRGIERALAEYGLPLAEVCYANEMSREDYRRVFASPGRPDGIISYNDFRLAQLLDILREEDILAPRDLDCIGAYNTPWAMAYGLSSVSINEPAILSHLERVLLDGSTRDATVQPQLICRHTSPAH